MEFLGLEHNTLRGIALIVLMVAFFGVVAWAWSGKRKETFHDASRLPLEEDDGEIPGTENVRPGKTPESEAQAGNGPGSKE